MNVNDIICLGAEPLALVNYLALEKTRPKLVQEIMIGLQKGAQEANVAIIGGETAIMPDVVKGFDLAATVIGLVNRKKIITGENIQSGDTILGLRSSGIHSNGLTLARKLLLTPRIKPEIARELLRPTRIYTRIILKLLNSNLEIHGLAHITGGGYSKLKRIGLKTKVGFLLDHLPQPQSIFKKIQTKGDISDREMYRTFNMGIGFLLICPQREAKRIKQLVPEILQVGSVTNTSAAVISLPRRKFEVEKW
jgi:phosphoribosylformylglycinamidine cyclo-ligase